MQIKRITFLSWTLFIIIVSSLMTVLSYHLFVFKTFSGGKGAEAFRDIGVTLAASSPIKSQDNIIEVMSYGCHYCAANEPNVAAFKKSLPQGATLSVIHIAGAANGLTVWAPLFATLEQMGLEPRLRDNAYFAIITQNQNLSDPKQLDTWLKNNHVDVERYHAVSQSAAVKQRLKEMEAIGRYYGISATPMFIVNKRYVVAQDSDFTAFAGRMLKLLDGKR